MGAFSVCGKGVFGYEAEARSSTKKGPLRWEGSGPGLGLPARLTAYFSSGLSFLSFASLLSSFGLTTPGLAATGLGFGCGAGLTVGGCAAGFEAGCGTGLAAGLAGCCGAVFGACGGTAIGLEAGCGTGLESGLAGCCKAGLAGCCGAGFTVGFAGCCSAGAGVGWAAG